MKNENNSNNLLKDTKELLKKEGLTLKDIEFINYDGYEITVDNFIEIADIKYLYDYNREYNYQLKVKNEVSKLYYYEAYFDLMIEKHINKSYDYSFIGDLKIVCKDFVIEILENEDCYWDNTYLELDYSPKLRAKSKRPKLTKRIESLVYNNEEIREYMNLIVFDIINELNISKSKSEYIYGEPNIYTYTYEKCNNNLKLKTYNISLITKYINEFIENNAKFNNNNFTINEKELIKYINNGGKK